MTHRLSWIASVVAVTGAAVLVTKLVGATPPPGDSAVTATAEAGMMRRPQPPGDRPGPAPQPGAAEAHAQKERRHYDRLDALARAGGGDGPAARLRRNIDAFRASNQSSAATLDIAALDCSETVCRVEVRPSADGLQRGSTATARALMPGMGRLSMRPAVVAASNAVYYLAPAGKQLPRLDP